jgi:hypothetical protein
LLAAAIFSSAAKAGIITVQSSSGQFVVREIQTAFPVSVSATRMPVGDGWAFLLPSHNLSPNPDKSEVTLEPSILAVSCERVKNLFLSELGLADVWQGRISVMIAPPQQELQQPRLTANYDPSGWWYNLELPKTVQSKVLIRALVDALFLEIANRNAGSQTAEIPCWLVEGMGAELQAYNFPTFILQGNVQMAGDRVKLEGLDRVRAQLRSHAPLSFQELSLPNDADLSGDGLELYRTCSQLFLEQLLQFNDGRVLLREMLRQLPDHLNWQTAFLSAFHPHFKQLLDVEKWWGLSYVDFTRDDLAEPLSAENCWKKLQDALDVPVQVHFGADNLPAEARITLQEVITQWSPADATPAIDRVLTELKYLHYRASPEIKPLVDSYLRVLVGYLVTDRPSLEWTLGKNHPSASKLLKSETVDQLDALDKHRSSLRPQMTASRKPSQFSGLNDAKLAESK